MVQENDRASSNAVAASSNAAAATYPPLEATIVEDEPFAPVYDTNKQPSPRTATKLRSSAGQLDKGRYKRIEGKLASQDRLDSEGHLMEREEQVENWRRQGICPLCGITRTHKKLLGVMLKPLVRIF